MLKALVLGDAACVSADVTAARKLGTFDYIIACNDISAKWAEDIDAMVSLHADVLALKWVPTRIGAGLNSPLTVCPDFVAYKRLKDKSVIKKTLKDKFDGQKHCGSSGLYSVKVALDIFLCDRVVCCGVPLDLRPHFYNNSAWKMSKVYHKGWQEALPFICDKVRSMSGWTKELIGAPTDEWLNGDEY